ncbi:hypothetical protein Ccrd_020277 [Cynara cardunculus var. scolymus]|uniref:Uncharacterized protein n=1 Tax=Cynara cardunculus var. scolymus TaxID=59895 RepID=A0A103Y2R0_CYNCS|nr:hypothetical protein Ccrd_020277 [Cynara cardunculus var. scolymus]
MAKQHFKKMSSRSRAWMVAGTVGLVEALKDQGFARWNFLISITTAASSDASSSSSSMCPPMSAKLDPSISVRSKALPGDPSSDPNHQKMEKLTVKLGASYHPHLLQKRLKILNHPPGLHLCHFYLLLRVAYIGWKQPTKIDKRNGQNTSLLIPGAGPITRSLLDL